MFQTNFIRIELLCVMMISLVQEQYTYISLDLGSYMVKAVTFVAFVVQQANVRMIHFIRVICPR